MGRFEWQRDLERERESVTACGSSAAKGGENEEKLKRAGVESACEVQAVDDKMMGVTDVHEAESDGLVAVALT